MIVFSIKLVDFLIAHKCGHSFRSLLSSAIQSQAFVFSPFCGWQGDNGSYGGLPEWECKTDRHSSSIDLTQGEDLEGGCSTNSPIYIRLPPSPPYWVMLNRSFPLRDTPRHLNVCNAWVIQNWTVGVWGTESNKLYYMQNIFDEHPPPRKKMLGPGTCLDVAYVRINHMTP